MDEQRRRKLRILATNHQLLDFTGSELFTVTLADFLKRLDHDVTVFSPYVDKLRQPLEAARVRVVENLEQIRNDRFDLAHVHHNVTAMEVRQTFSKLPIVYLSHGVLPYLEKPPSIDLRIRRFLAVSEEVRAALVESGIPEHRVDIFRNIVDSKRFQPATEPLIHV